MPFPFDATLKEIVRSHAAEYAAAFGYAGRPTRLLNVDLSTVSAATDIAFGIGDPLEEVLDVNFQTGADRFLAARTEMYRAILHHHYRVPVRTVIALMRPEADHAHLTGLHSYGGAANRVECRYEVLRIWERPAEHYFDLGVGMLPLATLGRLPENAEPEAALADIVRQINDRLTGLPEAESIRILTGAFILSGLRLERRSLSRIFRSYGMIKHTNAWDEMMYEGELRALRRSIIRQAQKRMGKPTREQETTLSEVLDSERLERMLDAVQAAANWDDLLATP